jgi:ankyrin repeat protein
MSKLKALFEAIKHKDKELVKGQLQEDESLVKSTDKDGWGPIHVCAAEGNQEIMKILVEDFKANVNQRTEYSYTPAQLAAKNHNIGCLIELMKHNADVTLTNRSGVSVMDFLAEGSHELGDIINHNFDSTLHLEQKDDHLKIVGHFIEYGIEIF